MLASCLGHWYDLKFKTSSVCTMRLFTRWSHFIETEVINPHKNLSLIDCIITIKRREPWLVMIVVIRCTRIANRMPCLHTATALFWHQRTWAAEYVNLRLEKVLADSTVLNLIIISVWKISFKVKSVLKISSRKMTKLFPFRLFIENNAIIENYVLSLSWSLLNAPPPCKMYCPRGHLIGNIRYVKLISLSKSNKAHSCYADFNIVTGTKQLPRRLPWSEK